MAQVNGKRLLPLSNEVRSKQFLKIFRKGNTVSKENTDDNRNAGVNGNIINGEGNSKKAISKESMVQRMYRMIREVASASVITIATSKDQIP